jgi:hypothetical protein
MPGAAAQLRGCTTLDVEPGVMLRGLLAWERVIQERDGTWHLLTE